MAELHITEKPWGRYQVLYAGKTVLTKRLYIEPGARLSLQSHSHRDETWSVEAGIGVVTKDESITEITKGDIVFIPKGVLHRVENTSHVPLVIFEVQIGDYLSEDDIIRVEDDYGRTK